MPLSFPFLDFLRLRWPSFVLARLRCPRFG
jgi:hypothetical protein